MQLLLFGSTLVVSAEYPPIEKIKAVDKLKISDKVVIINGQIPLRSRMQIKCADCGCFPDDCKRSKSDEGCHNCTLEECCCTFFNKS